MQRLLLVVAMLSACIAGGAITVQKLTKTDGDVLYGYISSQNPNTGEYVFMADSSKNAIYRNGSQKVRLKWDEIDSVEYKPQADGVTSGLVREYFSNGLPSVRGILLMQNYRDGNYVKIQGNEGTQLRSLANVIKIKTFALNSSHSIIEQAQLLDIVEKKGGMMVGPGVIVERNFEKEDPDKYYVVVKTKDDTTHTVYVKDIKCFHSVVNQDYKTFDIVKLKPGEMRVNGIEVGKALPRFPRHGSRKYMMEDQKEGNLTHVYYLTTDPDKFVIANVYQPEKDDDVVSLEASSDTCSITFEANDADMADRLSVGMVSGGVRLDEKESTMKVRDDKFNSPAKAMSFDKDNASCTTQYKFTVVKPVRAAMPDGKSYHFIFLKEKGENGSVIPVEILWQDTGRGDTASKGKRQK